jgi:hypothetical protein
MLADLLLCCMSLANSECSAVRCVARRRYAMKCIPLGRPGQIALAAVGAVRDVIPHLRVVLVWRALW